MRGIVKRFGATIALNGVDLDVHGGEIHALLGENGAGKSTLMHILAGMTAANEGEIRINGTQVRLQTPRQARSAGIAMVHQHFTLVPAFTVAENLALDTARTRNRGIYRALQVAEPALQRAAALGWELPANRRVADLPVGTQQRVEIVKALATDARILIFDEPTAVLAEAEIEELFAVLRLLRDQGHAVLLIAHKLKEILAVADRVTVLRRGVQVITRPVADCTAADLALWMVHGLETENRSPTVPPIRSDSPTVSRTELVSRETLMEVKGLTVRGGQGNLVLNGLNMTVRAGEILGIGGVDGNGQAELAETLVGLRKQEGGTLLWGGNAFTPGVAPRTGYIPQDRRRVGLATGLSVEENLLFDAVNNPEYRFGPLLRRRKLHDLAERLRRDYDIRVDSLQRPASTLSGGNQQKIVVARALHAHPDWIVAMNPTRGLDLGATRFVHAQLQAARDRGAAVVLISTDLDELAAIADRQAILSQGTLTEFQATQTDASQLGLLLGGVQQS